MGSRVVGSLLVHEPAAAHRRAVELGARGCAVELRVDGLDAEAVERLVHACAADGVETIVTARRERDGGTFAGDEPARRRLLERALAAGARWIDVEADSALADLADGSAGEATILSHHGGSCRVAETSRRLSAMRARGAGRFKLVPEASDPEDCLDLRAFLRQEGADGRLCAFATGEAGLWSRLLAPSWGSWGTYAAAYPGRPTAAGQRTVEEMLDELAVDRIGPATRIVALAGDAVLRGRSPSPAMHGAGYRALGLDRAYLPLECPRWDSVVAIAEGLDLAGLAVTIPFKTDAWACCALRDEVAEASAAVNTVLREDDGWRGFNTDGPAALELLQRRGFARGQRVDVLGAGGTARAIAASLAGAGGEVTLWRRSPRRALPGAAPPSVRDLEEFRYGAADWLVQATPVRDGRWLADGPPAAHGILDVVYGPRPTALVERAVRAALPHVDGLELLVAQAERQFALHTGAPPPAGLFAAVGQQHLAGRG